MSGLTQAERRDNCGLCGCEDEPYLPNKWEGCNAVNCVRKAWLKEQRRAALRALAAGPADERGAG